MDLTFPGEIISDESKGFMPGLGTYSVNGKIVASNLGYIKTIDKLINVVSENIPYKPDQGDIIVGRITSVEKGFWKANVNNKREGVLNIVNINLPKGEQRKRNYEDTLQMKNYFEENTLFSGEVLSLNSDGGMSLQTRNLKYGKLKNGMMIKVNPNLIMKMKSHFIDLFNNIKIILGKNGFVYVYYSTLKLGAEYFTDDENTVGIFSKEEKPTTEAMMVIVLVKNILSGLNRQEAQIDYATIMKFFEIYGSIKGFILSKKENTQSNDNSNNILKVVGNLETTYDLNHDKLKSSLYIKEDEEKQVIEKINSLNNNEK